MSPQDEADKVREQGREITEDEADFYRWLHYWFRLDRRALQHLIVREESHDAGS